MNTRYCIVKTFVNDWEVECWNHEGKKFSFTTDTIMAVSFIIHLYVKMYRPEAEIEDYLQNII